MSSLYSAARAYAKRGWPVHPLQFVLADGGCSCRNPECGSIGKHPLTPGGLKDATTDPAVLQRWWKLWPKANVGLVTGPTSGFWMLGPDGPEGLADLKQLIADHGPLPATYRVHSGSDGEHRYFRWPADGKPIPNRKNHQGLNIDVRGCGDGPGYVVAPPSVNAKGQYTILDDLEPAEAPEWLLAWVRTNAVRVSASKPRPGVIDRAKLYLAQCHPAVSGAGGHGQTFAVARALCWGFDLPPEIALGLLKEFYNPRCVPPWSDAELEHKVKDAATRDFGKPRGYLNVDLHPERGGKINSGDLGDEFRGGGTFSKSNSGDLGDAFLGVALWQTPSALPEMPPVPMFPLAIFPPKVGDYWGGAALALAVPTDYIAVPALALLGAAIGRTRAVAIKQGYFEVPALWVTVIAPPGSVKSASLKFARAPLARFEAEWMASHAVAICSFDTEMDRDEEQVKAWKKAKCEGEPPEKPRRPILRQATLDSTTTEAAAKVMGDNPRGIIVVKDELSGFVLSMNQYRSGGKGDDKQFWLSAWAGAPTKLNRAGTHLAGPLMIPSPFVGIAGMMTPSSLPELRGDNRKGEATEDGFVDRFLFSFPDPVDAVGESWAEVSEELKRGYAEVFTDLLGFEMVNEAEGPEDERSRPYIVKLGSEARLEWEDFTKSIAKRMNALDKFDPFRGVLSKLKGYGARLAILLWCLRRVCGELQTDSPIDAETIRKAAKLIDYFEAHGRRCLGSGWADRKHRIAKRVIRWLTDDTAKVAFSRTEAFQQLKDKRDVTSTDALTDVFKVLTDHGYIRPMDPTGSGKPGPVPEVYAVNPLWLRTPEK